MYSITGACNRNYAVILISIAINTRPTFPVVSARGSKHNIMKVFSKSSSYSLLARTKFFMASQSAIAKTPVSSIHVILNPQILTQDITSSKDISGFLLCIDMLPFFISVSTCLQTEGIKQPIHFYRLYAY